MGESGAAFFPVAFRPFVPAAAFVPRVVADPFRAGVFPFADLAFCPAAVFFLTGGTARPHPTAGRLSRLIKTAVGSSFQYFNTCRSHGAFGPSFQYALRPSPEDRRQHRRNLCRYVAAGRDRPSPHVVPLGSAQGSIYYGPCRSFGLDRNPAFAAENLAPLPMPVTETPEIQEIHPDVALVERSRAGDATAFAQLVRQYERQIFRVAQHITQNREDAEDITQDAFLKAYEKLHQFQGNSKFSTWLTRIAVNESLMRLRKRKTSKTVSMDQDVQTEDGSIPRDFAEWRPNPEQIFDQGELVRHPPPRDPGSSPRFPHRLHPPRHRTSVHGGDCRGARI